MHFDGRHDRDIDNLESAQGIVQPTSPRTILVQPGAQCCLPLVETLTARQRQGYETAARFDAICCH